MWQLTLTLLGGNPRASAAAGAVYVLGKARARVHTVQCTVYSVHLLGLGCGDMVIATATATSSTQHCSDPGTITWCRHNHHHHTSSWSVTTSSSSLVTVTVDIAKVTAAAAPKVVCLGRQVSGVSGDKFVHYGFRWDDAMVIQSWHFLAFSFMWLNVFRDYIMCRTWHLLNQVTG